MTYRVELDKLPADLPEGTDPVLETGITADRLDEVQDKADEWNAEAAENADSGIPTAFAAMMGLAFGHVSIVPEA